MLKSSQIDPNNYLIKQLPKATAFLNKKLEVIYASDQWIEDFEFSNGKVIGKKIGELLTHLSKDLQKDFKDCLKGNNGSGIKECYNVKDNPKKWNEWTNIPWYDEKENIIGVIVQTESITQKINNIPNIERLQLLIEEKSSNSSIGSWQYDAELNSLWWCEMSKQIHEVPKDFAPKIETFIDFFKEGHSKNTISMAFFEASEKGISWKEELQIVTEKGNEKWIITTGKPIYKNDKCIGLVGTFQDINEQVITNKKTEENELLLRTLIDSLPMNVFVKDLDSRKILVNKSELNFLGLKHESEALGKTDFDFLNKKNAQIGREEDIMVMENGIPMLKKETTNIKKDGTTTSFLTSKIPIKGANGKITGLVGLSLDISDLKKKEEELKNLINVTSLQNKKLVNFAHIVSHNLRSHTANFSMLLEFLVSEKDEEEKQNLINMLVEASDHLLETLNNLNEVVVINTNVNLKKQNICLNKKIKSVEKNLSVFLKNKNVNIINNIGDNVKIKAIPAYLDSILTNFFTNSVMYKSPDRDPIIKLSSSSENGYTILSISDNGLGIDLKKYGDKLFGMYKTFHNNPDAKGIGLFLAKNQIEAMNGKITTSSEVGKGTTFNIHFNENN
ncbi:MAG: PAS domain-containing protein [Maribacter sp.]|nr:PAS domain-containing protein [Maribacter sp.]